MSTPLPGVRCLTELDHVRLLKLKAGDLSHALNEMLDAAELVPSKEVPPDVVTVYTKVQVRELDSVAVREWTLCYPDEAEPHKGFLSVLSPVGLALLGQRVGTQVRWTTPSGASLALQVEAILFQPEASGDYTT